MVLYACFSRHDLHDLGWLFKAADLADYGVLAVNAMREKTLAQFGTGVLFNY